MEILILILIVIIVAIILFWNKDISPESKGRYGENIISAVASAEIKKGLYGHVLQNVYVPRNDGSTSEVDVVLVCTKGIFVFESKNYAGYIFGDDQHRNWTVSLYAGKSWMGFKTTEKHSFYNPIWQNRTHIKALRDLIKIPVTIYSIVVFSDRGELKNVTYDASKVEILQSNQLKSFMRGVRTMYSDVFTIDEVESIAALLSRYVGEDKALKLAHIESIRKKKEAPETCPWCGGRLVLRTAKKGSNAGKQFYGCSNYPKCRYTINKNR